MTGVLVICGVAAIVALAIAPFLLPWPQHLRWLVATLQTPDALMGSMSADADAREVLVESVTPRAGGLLIAVIDGQQRRLLEALARGDACEARLRRWMVSGVPLLQIVHPDGAISLHGPLGSATGLHRATNDVGHDQGAPRQLAP